MNVKHLGKQKKVHQPLLQRRNMKSFLYRILTRRLIKNTTSKMTEDFYVSKRKSSFSIDAEHSCSQSTKFN